MKINFILLIILGFLILGTTNKACCSLGIWNPSARNRCLVLFCCWS